MLKLLGATSCPTFQLSKRKKVVQFFIIKTSNSCEYDCIERTDGIQEEEEGKDVDGDEEQAKGKKRGE